MRAILALTALLAAAVAAPAGAAGAAALDDAAPADDALRADQGALRASRKLVSTRIINGKNAKAGDYPWMVSLQDVAVSTKYYHKCGGSLIHRRAVLTAAHCLPDKKLQDRAVLDTVDLTKPQVARLYRTPSGAGFSMTYIDGNDGYADDIAVIFLKNPVDNVPVIELNDDSSFENDGEELRVIGFGITEDYNRFGSSVLKELDVPVVSEKRCKKTYGSEIDGGMICAGFDVDGKDSCSGDSGGPLFKWNDKTKKAVQVGIVSFGRGCAVGKNYGVYTKVSHYYKQLKAIIDRLDAEDRADKGKDRSPSQPSTPEEPEEPEENIDVCSGKRRKQCRKSSVCRWRSSGCIATSRSIDVGLEIPQGNFTDGVNGTDYFNDDHAYDESDDDVISYDDLIDDHPADDA